MDLCLQDYKSLCTAVTTCATLVVPKFDSYILTPLALKSRSNLRLLCIHVRCTHGANLVTAGSRDTAHQYFCDRLITDETRSPCTSLCTLLCTLVPPWLSQNVLSILTPVTPKSRSNPRHLLYRCQMHSRCKFGYRRSVACRDNADISIFCDALKTQ